MPDDRVHEVLERCRQRRRPDLSASLVKEMAAVQLRHQFIGEDNRKEVRRDLERLIDEEMQRLGHLGSSR